MATSSLWMQRMFDSASRRYALLNRVLTVGQDDIWRQAAVNVIRPKNEERILDICTGTADLALKIAERFPRLSIYALDYSPMMLTVARKRSEVGARHNIIFKKGDCIDMEFESDYFDYVTISFGFRNLSYSKENLVKALGEIYRVLKKGGRFIILETSQPRNAFIKKIFHIYAASVVPIVGRVLSREKEPYEYLGRSIVKFYDKCKLAAILESCGFKKEKTESFMFGAILLYVAQKDLC